MALWVIKPQGELNDWLKAVKKFILHYQNLQLDFWRKKNFLGGILSYIWCIHIIQNIMKASWGYAILHYFQASTIQGRWCPLVLAWCMPCIQGISGRYTNNDYKLVPHHLSASIHLSWLPLVKLCLLMFMSSVHS